MTPPPKFFHALMRPAILQILRAVGYHSAKPSVLDTVTDIAIRYLAKLCELTAIHASLNSSIDHERVGMLEPPESASTTAVQFPSVPPPSIADIRLALQEVGEFLPERVQEEQDYLGIEDTRGVDQFIAWATGLLNKEIQRIALDGNDEARDYLDALKKKHSKNDDDTKFLGTLLGKPYEQGEILIEGNGELTSIRAWEAHMKAQGERPVLEKPLVNGDGGGGDSRPASSGLTSLASIADDMEMDIDG